MFKKFLVCLIATAGFAIVGCNSSAPPTEVGGTADATDQAMVEAAKKFESDPNSASPDEIEKTIGVGGGKGKLRDQIQQNAEK